MRRVVEPGDDGWHDKYFGFDVPFTCDHCGAKGITAEADAICEECGAKTRLPIEVEA